MFFWVLLPGRIFQHPQSEHLCSLPVGLNILRIFPEDNYLKTTVSSLSLIFGLQGCHHPFKTVLCIDIRNLPCLSNYSFEHSKLWEEFSYSVSFILYWRLRVVLHQMFFMKVLINFINFNCISYFCLYQTYFLFSSMNLKCNHFFWKLFLWKNIFNKKHYRCKKEESIVSIFVQSIVHFNWVVSEVILYHGFTYASQLCASRPSYC